MKKIATISLINGERIPFIDFFSKEEIIKSITSLKFDWIVGQYTGG